MANKKEKITYVDDGRSLADMSGVDAGAGKFFQSTPSYSTGREKWRTFWGAFRLMLLPTLAICGGMVVLFALMYLIFWLAQ